MAEENHENLQSAWMVYGPKFELVNRLSQNEGLEG
jgi:hypothetical protein